MIALGVLLLISEVILSIQFKSFAGVMEYSLFSIAIVALGFVIDKPKNKILSTITLVLSVSLFMMGSIALLATGFVNLIPYTYRATEITKLTPSLTENLEETYCIRLPESTEFVKGIYQPAFQDSTIRLWLDIAEEDFESIFIGDFWSELPSYSWSDSQEGFQVAGSKDSVYGGILYSYPENGRVSLYLIGMKKIGFK
jgi:hypothetical protein